MTPLQIVEMIQQDTPELLAGIPEKRAATLIAQGLAVLAQHLDSVDEGALQVPRFGRFQIRQVEIKKDGETTKVRRIFFFAKAPKTAA